MVVMTLELVPPRLKGKLTRWLTEIGPGVFVGDVNSMIREILWEDAILDSQSGSRIALVYSTNNEQGYAIRMYGDSKRRVVDLDGLQLVANKHMAWQDWLEKSDQG